MARRGWVIIAALSALAGARPLPAGAQSLPAGMPPAAAALDATSFPAAPASETLLHVTAPGRFAIATHSATGTALSLVDMITGPTDPDGEPGAHDGRLDLLLDRGTYKLRFRGAPGATGAAGLTVAPFQDAAPAAWLTPDAQIDAALTDLQSRAAWFVVSQDRLVHIEAAGRSLADLRLWRDGRDLAAITADASTIEPTHGHPLRDFQIDQRLPPGTYLITAYGGKPLPWANGDPSQPFHLREGASDALRPGLAAARIGPFGTERYRADGADDTFRLTMAGPATLTVDGQAAGIDRKSRVPEASLQSSPRKDAHLIEVQGGEGEKFRLRALRIGANAPIWRPGTYWITASTDGLGGDQIPATLVLGRRGPHGVDIMASSAPELGPRQAWHQRFSLGGIVSVIFHVAQGGPIAANLSGVPILAPFLVALDDGVRVDPVSAKTPALWDLAAGWYELHFAPSGNAAGVADLTMGPPGVTVQAGPPGPPSPIVSFGVQTVTEGGPLELIGNTAPEARLGLEALALPLNAAGAPLRVGQQAGQALDVPIGLAGPAPALQILGGGTPAFTVTNRGADRLLHLPAPDEARVIALTQPQATPAPLPPAPAPEAARPSLRDRVPAFFDFTEGVPRDFTLNVAQGGLLRVETLGRLRTRGAIGTHFVPELERADANGDGQNMLLQGYLRAGRYHVDVTAEASAGHAGIVALPAHEQTSAVLPPDGTIRATLPAGEGLLVPIQIPISGRYRLALLGLNRVFTARLEDAQGWPLAAAAPFTDTTQDLVAGQYRLRVTPQPVDARALVHLTRIVPPAKLAGHGPHALPFGAAQDFTWREPAGRANPRAPDIWVFVLAAAATIDLSLSDGMQGNLIGPDGSQAAHPVGGAPFHGRLLPGPYRLEATSQGRNDRLDYTVSLTADALQPGVPRDVGLPASLHFALARDQVVSLTSFGGTPVRAVLRDGAGQVLGRFGARAHDWNIAISRLLPAGAYTLDLASAAPPAQTPIRTNPNDRPTPAAPAPDAGDQAEAAPGDQPQPNDPGPSPDMAAPDDGAAAAGPDQASPDQAPPEPVDASANADAPAPDSTDSTVGPAAGGTEITLALPADAPYVPLAGGGATLTGGGVHHIALPKPMRGDLFVAGAASTEAVVISLEQLQDNGAWRSLATAQGLLPVLALPPEGSKDGSNAWRLSVWPVDGGALPVHVAAQRLTVAAAAGPPILAPLSMPGVATNLAIAHVALPTRGLLRLTGDASVAAWPGHAAERPEAGLIAPQANDLWLLARSRAVLSLVPVPPGAPLVLTLPQGVRAALPASPGLTAFIAEAQGQPGLDAGHGMGVAENSALALHDAAGFAPHDDTGTGAIVWNAGEGDALRVTARPVPLTQVAALQPGVAHILPPASAAIIDLPPGARTWRLDLPPGTAAVAGWPAADAVTVWAGRESVSRTLQGGWTRALLVNTGAAPATLGLDVQDAGAVEAIRPDHAARRFFGAAGSLDLAVAARPGQTLITAGNAVAVFTGADGSVRRGNSIALTGPGRVTLLHGAGLVACWLDGAGAQPWPAPTPIRVDLPRSLALSGEAMQLDLSPAQAGLLRVRSTAPVILALGDEAPILFPAGAAFSRYLAAGPARLRIIAPQDGALSGSAELTVSPIRPAVEGLGETVTIAAGDAALFGFTLDAARRIGVGVQAQPDRANVRLLDAQGHVLASGGAMLRALPAGRYVAEISVPVDAPATLVRPAFVGLTAAPNGPPADVVAFYRKLGK